MRNRPLRRPFIPIRGDAAPPTGDCSYNVRGGSSRWFVPGDGKASLVPVLVPTKVHVHIVLSKQGFECCLDVLAIAGWLPEYARIARRRRVNGFVAFFLNAQRHRQRINVVEVREVDGGKVHCLSASLVTAPYCDVIYGLLHQTVTSSTGYLPIAINQPDGERKRNAFKSASSQSN